MARALSEKRRAKVSSRRPRWDAASSVSRDMRMGVSGFLISCASRWATSCHAAMRSLASSWSVATLSAPVMPLKVLMSVCSSRDALFVETVTPGAPEAMPCAASVSASTGRVMRRLRRKPPKMASNSPTPAKLAKARSTCARVASRSAREKLRLMSATPSEARVRVTTGGGASPARSSCRPPLVTVTSAPVRCASASARAWEIKMPPTAHTRRSP